ncbi:unnamed protein product [Protopolystoma xenopodis]|uniref:Uncharacterized protein n=1 Tax=Protopolystoma xenopodis TaxID=117903 RepID=A0A3S5AHV5_9PLAT|nr:unnamed protein product [Protopolystoma xenopodis]
MPRLHATQPHHTLFIFTNFLTAAPFNPLHLFIPKSRSPSASDACPRSQVLRTLVLKIWTTGCGCGVAAVSAAHFEAPHFAVTPILPGLKARSLFELTTRRLPNRMHFRFLSCRLRLLQPHCLSRLSPLLSHLPTRPLVHSYTRPLLAHPSRVVWKLPLFTDGLSSAGDVEEYGSFLFCDCPEVADHQLLDQKKNLQS